MSDAIDDLRDMTTDSEIEIDETQEQENEYKVPENIQSVISSLKNDLRKYLDPLPQGGLNQVNKYLKNLTGDQIDYWELTKELPLFFKDIINHVENKKRMLEITESNILEILNNFENKAIVSETRAKDLVKQQSEMITTITKLNGDIIGLSDKNEKLWGDRLSDIKEDPIRTYTEEFLKQKIDELRGANSIDIKQIGQSTPTPKKPPKEPEPEPEENNEDESSDDEENDGEEMAFE